MKRRPRTRAECIDGPRPCLVLSCPHNLGREVLGQHPALKKLRVTESDIDDAAELAIARLLSSRESCVLDVTDRHPDGLDAGAIAELLGISTRHVHRIETGAHVLNAFDRLRDRDVRIRETSCSGGVVSPVDRFVQRQAARGLLAPFAAGSIDGTLSSGAFMKSYMFYRSPLAIIVGEPRVITAASSAPRAVPPASAQHPTPPSEVKVHADPDGSLLTVGWTAAEVARATARNPQIARMARCLGITTAQLQEHAPRASGILPELKEMIADTEARGDRVGK